MRGACKGSGGNWVVVVVVVVVVVEVNQRSEEGDVDTCVLASYFTCQQFAVIRVIDLGEFVDQETPKTQDCPSIF